MPAARPIGGFSLDAVRDGSFVAVHGARSWAGVRVAARGGALGAVQQERGGGGRDGAGRGLGLALCRRLAVELGGRLDIAAATARAAPR